MKTQQGWTTIEQSKKLTDEQIEFLKLKFE